MTNKTISESSYVHPEVLFDTKWLEAHLHDQKLRIAEVDYDSSANHELGHIPGAVLIDWKKDINDSIRRRSSHNWFDFKYLLGYPNAKNYDGSWTEWGNLINNPIEK